MDNKYKRECMISTRTDIRLLAGLVLLYKNRNELARTKSSLVGDAIEDFALFLENTGKIKIPATYTEAIDIMKQNNFNFLSSSDNRTQRGLVKELAKEEFVFVGHEEVDISSIAKKVGDKITGD